MLYVFHFIALSYTDHNFTFKDCGDSLGGTVLDISKCQETPCPADDTQACGGSFSLLAYVNFG
jgi:hypothetical protein